jgi:hypothetical protein
LPDSGVACFGPDRRTHDAHSEPERCDTPSHGRLRRQVDSLGRQFLQHDGLPFADVLAPADLEGALREVSARWKDRIFTPLITLGAFPGQALAADPSCRAAAARLIA